MPYNKRTAKRTIKRKAKKKRKRHKKTKVYKILYDNIDWKLHKYKYDPFQVLLYLFTIDCDIDVEQINDLYDVANINNQKCIKVGRTDMRNLSKRMNKHQWELGQNIDVLDIVPLRFESYEHVFHNSMRRYLQKKGVYIHYENSLKCTKVFKKPCRLLELYPIYCLKMISNIFRDFEQKICPLITQYGTIPDNVLQSYDTMDEDLATTYIY